MLFYFGFLVDEDWLVERGVTLGLGNDNTKRDRHYTIGQSTRDIRKKARLGDQCDIRRVVTKRGNDYWCIALASNDPREGMYTPHNMPPQEHLDRLKAVLEKEDHIQPQWWKAKYP
ncbi:hypothetical protein OBBRIDRAFT_789670 [Obba rivulosa]|uniref:Uncharacterized protein n=1 Tax=Obba rivulosa TaxID=1052685 RepID=A0A8E2DQK7_9APHY|nr:hypothetical protein OBBRIDRAFT_789670 [Obba rivulosa]